MRVVALEEGATDAEGTGAGDGLSDGNEVLTERGRIGAICKLKSGLGEVGYTGDASVLFVKR